MPKTQNKQKVLRGLLEANSIRGAAKTAGLSEETFYRYLRDPEFIKEYRTARRQIVEHSVAQIQRLTSAAVETLERNLHCTQPAIEIRCAQIVIETAIAGVDKIAILEQPLGKVDTTARRTITSHNAIAYEFLRRLLEQSNQTSWLPATAAQTLRNTPLDSIMPTKQRLAIADQIEEGLFTLPTI
ncbi:MAG: hypothetical protein WBD22_09200 [Pyrinomonadaceae bacterium]